MMKLIIIVLVVALATLVYCAIDKNCSAEARKDGLTDLYDGNPANDHKVKKYYLCLSKANGILDDSGNFVEAKARKLLNGTIFGPGKGDQAYDKCAVNKDTPEETALHLLNCTFELARLSAPDMSNRVLIFKYDECAKSSGISEEAYDKFRIQNNFGGDADAATKEYFLCEGKRKGQGFFNASGDFEEKKIEAVFFRIFPDQATSDAVYKECVVKRDTPQETAFDFYRCLTRRTGFHIY